MADRALGQIQFVCSLGETHVSRSDRKYSKCIKRWQSRHVSLLRIRQIWPMNSTNNCRLSFVLDAGNEVHGYGMLIREGGYARDWNRPKRDVGLRLNAPTATKLPAPQLVRPEWKTSRTCISVICNAVKLRGAFSYHSSKRAARGLARPAPTNS